MSVVNWRIGYRLGIGFIGLIIMLFAVSILSIMKLSAFNQDAKLIVTDTYADTVDANNLRNLVNQSVIAYDSLLLSSDEK